MRRARLLRNQARAAVAREIVVHPLDEDQHAIFKFHQVHQVHEDPKEPRRKAGDMQLSEFRDGFVAADGGQIACYGWPWPRTAPAAWQPAPRRGAASRSGG